VNGLVLDTSALLAYASGTSVEPGAMLTLVDEDPARRSRYPRCASASRSWSWLAPRRAEQVDGGILAWAAAGRPQRLHRADRSTPPTAMRGGDIWALRQTSVSRCLFSNNSDRSQHMPTWRNIEIYDRVCANDGILIDQYRPKDDGAPPDDRAVLQGRSRYLLALHGLAWLSRRQVSTVLMGEHAERRYPVTHNAVVGEHTSDSATVSDDDAPHNLAVILQIDVIANCDILPHNDVVATIEIAA
jgi:hypothetical protein